MRILVASDSFAPKIDGVSDTAGIVARELADRGHRVLVLAPGPGDRALGRAKVLRLPSFPMPLYPEMRIAVPFARVSRVVGRFRPDAALVLTPGPAGLATLRALPRHVRAVNVYTTDIPRYLDAYRLGFARPAVDRGLRWMAARSIVTLCPTETVRRELAARGFPRLEVWGRGVDTQLFCPGRRSSEMRRRLAGGQPGAFLVLYVGRIAREKRLGDLSAAARLLPGTRFAFVGDGPFRPELERQFAGLPAVFTGYLRGAALAAAFASADVFAFPSGSDTFGQVVVQAMACALPPVVAGGSATAELVPHGVAGLHVPLGQPPALAAAIQRIASDAGLRERLASGAVTHATAFSWARLLDRLEALLAGASARTGEPALTP